MTQPLYFDEPPRLFGVVRHNNQRFSVVGDAVAFYVFIQKGDRGDSSGWIRGRANLHRQLRELFDRRKRRKLAEEVERLYKENRVGSR